VSIAWLPFGLRWCHIDRVRRVRSMTRPDEET
jgi:hypothetical protein